MDLNDNIAPGSPPIDRASAFQVDAPIDGESVARTNGVTNGHLDDHAFGMHELLHALQAMRKRLV